MSAAVSFSLIPGDVQSIVGNGTLLPDHSLAEVPKPLGAVALLDVACQDRTQLAYELIAFHRIFVEPIQSSAAFVAAEVKLIFVGPFAYERNLGHVRPGAAVGTP